jgi:hypothetical protein
MLYQSDKSDPQEGLSNSGNEKFPLRSRPILEDAIDVDEEEDGRYYWINFLFIAAFLLSPPLTPALSSRRGSGVGEGEDLTDPISITNPKVSTNVTH